MTDKYIEELYEIRRSQYEETKDMTPEERDEYSRIKVERVKKRLEEIKLQKINVPQTVVRNDGTAKESVYRNPILVL